MQIEAKNNCKYIKTPRPTSVRAVIKVFVSLFLPLSIFFVVINLINFAVPDHSTNEVLYIVTHIFLFATMVFCLLDLKKNFLYLLFAVCFFTFLLARNFLEYMVNGTFDLFSKFHYLTLSDYNFNLYIATIFYSIAMIFWIHFWFTYVKKQKKKVETPIFEDKKSFKRIAKIGFFIAFPFQVIVQFASLITIKNTSYGASYLIESSVPSIIRYISAFFFVLALLYLACKPKKLEMLFVLISVLVLEGLMPLLGGARFGIAKCALFFLFYLFIYYREFGKNIITKKNVIILVFLGIAGVVLFATVGFLRSGEKVTISLNELIILFFDSIGGSNGVIANTIAYQDLFPKDGYMYLFDPIFRLLFDNPISRVVIEFFTGKSLVPPEVQGQAYLEYYNTLAHSITAIVDYGRYIGGSGMGSAYIAEAWLAFGVPGTICVGGALGYIIYKIQNIKLFGKGIFKTAILLMMCFNLFAVPRNAVFSLIDQITYLVLAYVICSFLSKLFMVRKSCQTNKFLKVKG